MEDVLAPVAVALSAAVVLAGVAVAVPGNGGGRPFGGGGRDSQRPHASGNSHGGEPNGNRADGNQAAAPAMVTVLSAVAARQAAAPARTEFTLTTRSRFQ